MKPFIFLLFISMFFSGCLKPVKLSTKASVDPTNIKNLAQQLNKSLRKPALKNRESGVMTIVSLNNLEKTEIIGRYLQEHLASELYQLGFRVVEIRQGNSSKYVKEKGEMILTRDKQEINKKIHPSLKSMFTGTYVDTGTHIYVAARMVELETGIIRASGQIRLKKTKDLGYITGIKMKKKPTFKDMEVYERFPLHSEGSNEVND